MKQTRQLVRAAAAYCVIWSQLLVACSGRTPTAVPTVPVTTMPSGDLPDGLDLRLSEGSADASAGVIAKATDIQRMSDADADALLGRASSLTAMPGDKAAFALRPSSSPPPKTGNTISGTFPPPPTTAVAPAASSGALEVLRVQPEGPVPLAPQVSVTFSQPMVAVTSQDVASQTKPVTLTPEPEGRWRWLGTRTIIFDPAVRMPQATSYTIEIPAGTKSATGSALTSAKRVTFTTPPPRLVTSVPSGISARRETLIYLQFDQKINADAIVRHARVTADSKSVAVRMATPEEIANDRHVRQAVDAATKGEQAGRFAVLRPLEPLLADADIRVVLPKGMPSAEGPLTTTSEQSASFRTYAPLRVTEITCGWGHQCPPGSPFLVQFNNSLDAKALAQDQIVVRPALSGLKVAAYGNSLQIYGQSRANTSYEITVRGSIVDEFGQKLGSDKEGIVRVGPATEMFHGPSGMIMLDPLKQKPTLDYFTVNYDALDVTLYSVTPRDYGAYLEASQRQWDRQPPALPGKRMWQGKVPTTKGKDEMVETPVDLTPALSGKTGHVVAVITPLPKRQDYDQKLVVWAQVTQLAVDAAVDSDTLYAFTTRLADGAPVGDADVTLGSGVAGKTNGTGRADLPLPDQSAKGLDQLVVTKGADSAFLVAQDYFGSYMSWVKRAARHDLLWYVTDDRTMYRPGEEVHLKGWMRRWNSAKGGDIEGLTGPTSVTFEVNDSQGNQIAKGETSANRLGGFDVAFKLPATPNLGYAQIMFTALGPQGGSTSHAIRIEEFRRPEFEVSVSASQGPHAILGAADVTAKGAYFAGGGLPGAPVDWNVTATRATYTPPGRDDFTFGEWIPWWWSFDYAPRAHGRSRSSKRGGMPVQGDANQAWQFSGKTNALGEHTLHMDFLSSKPAYPMSVSAQATVTDVNRQAWSSGTNLMVHPSERYVGLRREKLFVDAGKPIELDVLVVDLDGKAIAGHKVEITSVRQDWAFEGGESVAKEVDKQTCTITSRAESQACSLPTKEGGQYQVTAVVYDERGRPNQTRLTQWVAGGDRLPSREVEQESVELVPNKKEYAVGETAEILVVAPFAPAEGIVTWRRSGVIHSERITLKSANTTIAVPITEAHVPNVFVQVDLVGAAARQTDAGDIDAKLPKRPAYASGQLNLSVPPRTRSLQVAVKPAAPRVAPGEATQIDAVVKDAQGNPVADADVAIMVVDEAVLSLSGKQFADPLLAFYPQRGADVSDWYARARVVLAQPAQDALGEQEGALVGGAMNSRGVAAEAMADMAAPMAAPPPMPVKKMRAASLEEGKLDKADGGGGNANAPIAVRSNFNPLAAFAPDAKTDALGRVQVKVKVPDNLTRYRIVALAAAGTKQYGKGESALTARLPLMVRPSAPRFFNFGDTLELPVVLQNQTDTAMKVKVAVRASNASLTDGRGRVITVPANDRVEVRFPTAAEMAGTARFQFVASSGNAADAAELALPVWTPATTEAFATYGVIDDGAIRQPVQMPPAVVTQFGGLSVQTASTQLQALTDAVLYLATYPFDCAEQRASRILSIAALRDVLRAFASPDMPSEAALAESMATDIRRLAQMQNDDGGFAFWERYHTSWPYLTVHVTHALVRAQAKGYAVPADVLERGLEYLRTIEQRYPAHYPPSVRNAITSYALNVRALAGQADLSGARAVMSRAGTLDKLPVEAVGWLLGVFAGDKGGQRETTDIVKFLTNRATETAGAANFTTSYSDGAHLLLHSDHRTDGVVLDSLIEAAPKSDLIVKVVAGLLAHKKRGRWGNTQENVFALLALDRYFRTYENITPAFVARAWLGTSFVGEHTFRGRQTDTHETQIPMAFLAKQGSKPSGTQDLILQKDGAGRMYYRIGMTYAPADLNLPAADYGFVVERTYEPVDAPSDVTKKPDGTWTFKAGAKVRVRLRMVAENRRYHVALVDKLPAGLEVMNPALATNGPIPDDPKADDAGPYWWWSRTWYEHQNIRDERVEAFTSLLWEGVHEYTYVARATTPGNFVVPPAKAEEMYAPETFGRSAGDRVVIE